MKLNREDLIQIDDESICKMVALQRRSINGLLALSKLGGRNASMTAAFPYCIEGCDCWASLWYFSGFKPDTENGWKIVAMPQSKCSQSDFNMLIAQSFERIREKDLPYVFVPNITCPLS